MHVESIALIANKSAFVDSLCALWPMGNGMQKVRIFLEPGGFPC